MLRRGLKIACCHDLMYIVQFLEDADQWQSHSPVWCHFVCAICLVIIGVDESIVYSRGRQPLARVPQVARERIFYGTPSDLTRM